MKLLLAIIILGSSLFVNGQEDKDTLKIEVLIIVSSVETGGPIPNAELLLFTPDKDTLYFQTNASGQILLSNHLEDSAITFNQSYEFEILAENKMYNGNCGVFNTNSDQNIKIIKEILVQPITGCGIPSIQFIKGSSQLADSTSSSIVAISDLLKMNPNVIIELQGVYENKPGQNLVEERLNVVYDSLISLGINSDRLIINVDPRKFEILYMPNNINLDKESGVTFKLVGFDFDP